MISGHKAKNMSAINSQSVISHRDFDVADMDGTCWDLWLFCLSGCLVAFSLFMSVLVLFVYIFFTLTLVTDTLYLPMLMF